MGTLVVEWAIERELLLNTIVLSICAVYKYTTPREKKALLTAIFRASK